MQPEPKTKNSQRGISKLPVIIALVVILALGIWLYLQQGEQPEPEPTTTTEPAPEQEEEPPAPEPVEEAPDIPEEPESASEEPAPEPEPEPELPPVSESDPYVREVLEPLDDNPVYEQWLQTDDLAQKSASVIDGLARGKVLRKVIPMEAPEEPFAVERDGDRILMAESNYRRFDPLTEAFTNVPPEQMAESFQSLRPLLESAYGELGKSEDMLDNSVIAAIDRILATPEVEYPIPLKQESVAYQYADPELESLPEVQKQIIRMGPENAERIKEYLRQVREELLKMEDVAP